MLYLTRTQLYLLVVFYENNADCREAQDQILNVVSSNNSTNCSLKYDS